MKKLEKMELQAFLGFQARKRELDFMNARLQAQAEELTKDFAELKESIEARLEIENLADYDLDTISGELLDKPKLDIANASIAGNSSSQHAARIGANGSARIGRNGAINITTTDGSE